MRNWLITLLIAVACVAVAQVANRQLELLRKAFRAQGELKYSGERLVEAMVDGDRIVLSEFVLRDGPRSRITYPENSPRKDFIVVETEQARWEYNPVRNEIIKSRPRHREGLELIGGMVRGVEERRFSLKLLPEEQIAGRRAVGLGIADRDGNFGRKLWIDPQTGMVLKAEQFGRAGHRMASFTFRRVNFDPVIRSEDFAPPRREGAKVIEGPADFDVPWAVQTPSWLPEGFRELERGLRPGPPRPGEPPVLMIVYTDGNRRFTIFQSMGREGPEPPRGQGRRGLNIARSRVGNIWSMVVGDLEPETLKRVAESIGRR